MPVKIAVIQRPPVLLDRGRTLTRAVEAIDEAASAGATLLVFPEAYIPGYPAWIWRLKPGGDMALLSELHAQLRLNAIDLDRDHLASATGRCVQPWRHRRDWNGGDRQPLFRNHTVQHRGGDRP